MARKQLGSAPSNPEDAATKAYVDAAIGGIGGSDLVNDTTPQLGGNLDLNGFTVGAATAANLTKLNAMTASATELNYVTGVTSAIQTQLNGKQAADADLTTIAGLTATTNNVIQSVGSAWASRTPAQLKATLGLTSSDVGLGNVVNVGQYYPGGSDVAVSDGGTGASDAGTARSNLGLSTVVYGSVNGSGTSLTLWTGSAAQYAAIGSKDSNTIYIVT